jgi:uncharacterized membrane protein
MDGVQTALTIVSLVVAFGAVGAWLLTAGRNMQRNEETAKDVEGIGRKVERVRQDLQGQINENKQEHDSLAREVSEIRATTASTHKLVEQLVTMHMSGKDDGR